MIFIGSDHRGFHLKEELKKYFRKEGIDFVDVGNNSFDPNDDYPDFAKKVAEGILVAPKNNKGIVICGSGVGVDITCNRFKGVRCGLALNKDQVRMARNDDDINCLAIASDFFNFNQLKEIVDTFLNAKFSGQYRHKKRIAKIEL